MGNDGVAAAPPERGVAHPRPPWRDDNDDDGTRMQRGETQDADAMTTTTLTRQGMLQARRVTRGMTVVTSSGGRWRRLCRRQRPRATTAAVQEDGAAATWLAGRLRVGAAVTYLHAWSSGCAVGSSVHGGTTLAGRRTREDDDEPLEALATLT